MNIGESALLMQKYKVPVFYHIPKNAGTYVSDWMMAAFRYYRQNYTEWLKSYNPGRASIKCLQITNNGFIIAKFLIGDPNYFCETFPSVDKKHSNSEWDIDIKNLPKDLFKNVFLFGIVIEARGFKCFKHLLEFAKDYELYQFIILRDSFSRAQSFYNYITSNLSIHERTHGLIKSDTFQEYVMSDQLEDSWLIRNLINIDDSVALEEQHFVEAINLLKDFHVYNIKNTSKAIQETFLNCYSFDLQQIKLNLWDAVTKNQTFGKKINFQDLSKEAQDVFTKRTYWDNKLYNVLLNI